MEELINKVIELAEKLGYNEDAQVMAIKSVLPRDVYGLCLTMKTTKELKKFLVEFFANPRMRESVSGEQSLFLIGYGPLFVFVVVCCCSCLYI